jgi:hypothetical protein
MMKEMDAVRVNLSRSFPEMGSSGMGKSTKKGGMR